MRLRRQSVLLNTILIALVVVALTPGEVSNARTKNPFDSLLGTWTGSGRLVLQGGQREDIKCNAYYTGGGSKLRLAVRCASASYKVEIRSKLTRAGDEISGTWEERTYNAAGSVSGRVRHQIIWNRFRFELTECLAHLVCHVRRRPCGVASGVVRMSFV